MKKLLCLLMVTAVLLCGCTTRVKPQIDISEKYYYLTSQVEFNAGTAITLFRFNVENGRMTTLCPDPLCDHGEECPFFDVINYSVDGNIIRFDRIFYDSDGEFVNAICEYDISEGKLRVLKQYKEDGYTNTFKFGYFWHIFTIQDPERDFGSFRVSIEEENFDDPEKVDPDKMPFAQVGDVYYYAKHGPFHSPATEVYAMYTDLTDEWLVADGMISSGFKYYEGFLYYVQKDTLMRVSVDEEITGIPINTKETVMDRMNKGGYFFHNGYLYYLQEEEDPEVIGWDEFLEEDALNIYGGKVWRAKPDGSRAELLTQTDGYVIAGFGFANAQVGGKLVMRYGYWKDKQTRDGEMRRAWRSTEGGLLVIDLDDGTYQGYAVFDE